MASFTFLGIYQTWVELPDGQYRLTDPGEVADLDFTDPGPLWAKSGTKAAKAAAAAQPDPEVALTPAADVAPSESEK
jgi:hypothetical protein